MEPESLRKKESEFEAKGQAMKEEVAELQSHFKETQLLLVEERQAHEKKTQELEDLCDQLRKQNEDLERGKNAATHKQEKLQAELERLRNHLITLNEESTAEALKSNETILNLQRQLEELQADPSKIKPADEAASLSNEQMNRHAILEQSIQDLQQELEKERDSNKRHLEVIGNLQNALEMIQAGSLTHLLN